MAGEMLDIGGLAQDDAWVCDGFRAPKHIYKGHDIRASVTPSLNQCRVS